MDIIQRLCDQFQLKQAIVQNIVTLLDEGNSVPFIARYRKELTGSMDDQLLRDLSDRLQSLRSLAKRKQEVQALLEEQGIFSELLAQQLSNVQTLTEVEDLYRPYKPKRRTRGTIAREKGLEPLAARLLVLPSLAEPLAMAAEYISAEKDVPDAQAALDGAIDILAEDMSDDAANRKLLREQAMRSATLQTTAATDQDSVFRMYYEFEEKLPKVQDYHVLAINRGEREELLKVKLNPDEAAALNAIRRRWLKNSASPCAGAIEQAIEDSYKRLIKPSIEREIRTELTVRASENALRVFGTNLRQLLMQPPVRDCTILGLDPGYRNGCKWAIIDQLGNVKGTGVIYPTAPRMDLVGSAHTVLQVIQQHSVGVIAIGNGTASRETEVFVADLIEKHQLSTAYIIVNEAGASVYSASKLAAQEFPDYDVSVRSAISIARRLQDPLAELVKVDPKSIGVGQYQHDMKESRLDEVLGGVVEGCVNSVGINLNTASAPLLAYVSGIGPALASNIIAYREEHGAFTNRKQLKEVRKLGAKAFEQCAGFLRILESDEPLDNTGIHPESYKATHALIKQLNFTKKDLQSGKNRQIVEEANKLGVTALAEKMDMGDPTLKDILKELEKPGRDPRDELPQPLLRRDVLDIDALAPGMKLQGTVRNVIDFGAFVDIGVHQDGLVHISRLANKFVRHPSEIVQVGDLVTVWVLEVDKARKRISLTMRENDL